ncbi:MAG: serine hydrolase [Pseudomonadota bacterium]
MKAMTRVVLVGLALVGLVGGTGILWLRASPYWAGVTLFAKDHRIENFRAMDQVFPGLEVPTGTDLWELPLALGSLPEVFSLDGVDQSVADFLAETSTTGLLVLQEGRIVHEEYRLGASETSRFTSFSVAKSVLSALIGVALAEGHIDRLNDQIVAYVPALKGSAYEGVTISQALQMSSGVRFGEDYDNPFSDVNRLTFALAFGQDLEAILAGLDRERPPGEARSYASVDTIALGLVLTAATGMPNEAYLADRLWRPMGAEADAFWNTGRAGAVLPHCCLNARLRDYARFGQLFLDGGRRGDLQILPEAWVARSTRPSAPPATPSSAWPISYGYQWWVPERPGNRFVAIGIWGQYIYVDRAKRVVIVKTSADPGFDTRDRATIALFHAIAHHVRANPS